MSSGTGAVVIGVGNPMRRDDGVGPAAVGALERAGLGERIRLLVSDGEPSRLLDAWCDHQLAIVVDAVVGDAKPGHISRLDVNADTVNPKSATSSHSPGLCEALRLAEVLGRAPDQLVLFGVQPDDLGFGPNLSSAVAGALPDLTDQITAEVLDLDRDAVAHSPELAYRLEVSGIVQGVGFRPFIHRLAQELGLRGSVGNDTTKVFIDVAGTPSQIERFAKRLVAEAPPLAAIRQVTRHPIEDGQYHTWPGGFSIVDSVDSRGTPTPIPPDAATCSDCRRELFDRRDRRFRHPFITCTNCGPRFTIITDVPYDRPNTAMADFALCDRCRAEYEDLADRRHHAQPICCHDCGPILTFRNTTRTADPTLGAVAPGAEAPVDPITQAADALAGGAIVAIKGLGGYHLACDATADGPPAELRRRKGRPDKPFAVMVADLDQAGLVANVGPNEARILSGPAAPIVLLRARDDSPISTIVAPGNPLIGVMLASTPLHHLLFDRGLGPLVMTSANRAGGPIAWNAELLADVEDLPDAVLDHDRPIVQPCDDSVVRLVGDRLLPLRRARGYAPMPVPIVGALNSVLAVGAELKNTVCLVDRERALLSPHIGDLENLGALKTFETAIDRIQTIDKVEPSVVAVDAHPGYVGSGWARRNHPERVLEIQHHHAHIASVMAEHQLDPATPIIGFAFDGTGYGDDGTIWGGEVLIASADRCHRAAHLAPFPLPGGEAAVRQPARVALALLHTARMAWHADLPPVAHFGQDLDLLAQQLVRGINCPQTTSMGRMFDAVASLVGIRHTTSYEAQAAIELEIAAARARRRDDPGYRFAVTWTKRTRMMVWAPVLAAVVADVAAGVEPGRVAWRFHQAVAAAVVDLAAAIGQERRITDIALSGGVFQNALLTELCVDGLDRAGLCPHVHEVVPPNDGGLALGQAYIAAHRTMPYGEHSGRSEGP